MPIFPLKDYLINKTINISMGEIRGTHSSPGVYTKITNIELENGATTKIKTGTGKKAKNPTPVPLLRPWVLGMSLPAYLRDEVK